MKILCVFGKYQYGKKERGLNTEYLSFIPAFKSLGHEVIFFDSWDKTLYKDFIELNNNLIRTVEAEKPNIIFSVQFLYEIWIETWSYIRYNFDCKTINWCTDDSWKYRQHSKFLGSYFDLMVTTYKDFLPKYSSQGINVLLSTWAVPIQWVKAPKKARDCKYKVTFIGAAHGNRKEKIVLLKQYGIDVKCFGHGWESGPIDGELIGEIFNDSVISLNFANSNGENQIKARVFEVTGSGGFLLTENAKNLNDIFNQDEIVIFSSIEHCAELIKYYLDNFQERDFIVGKSFKKTSNNFTYVNCVKKILDALNNIDKKQSAKVDFTLAINNHKKTILSSIYKNILIFIGRIFFGKEKGKRFGRRLAYEISWRLSKEKTYSSKGIVGRMFYNE